MNAENNEKHASSSNVDTFSDAFSDVLRMLRLTVELYHNAKICGNWMIRENQVGATCFHLVTEGECCMDVPGYWEGRLHFGDLVIFPHELPHRITSAQQLTGPQRHLDYQSARHIQGTGLLCGEMFFQHKGSRYLLDALPPVLIIRHSAENAWLSSLLGMIVAESCQTRAASKVLLDKLSELLFIHALAQHLADKPNELGVLSVYTHPRLAKALNAIHQHPEKAWTLELMAAEAALSRTAFAETFKAVSGWTPGSYLTWWRMQVAWSLLVQGESVIETAYKVGYQSESAFSRVFKMEFQVTPGMVRRAGL